MQSVRMDPDSINKFSRASNVTPDGTVSLPESTSDERDGVASFTT
jgi:hypothetical protein